MLQHSLYIINFGFQSPDNIELCVWPGLYTNMIVTYRVLVLPVLLLNFEGSYIFWRFTRPYFDWILYHARHNIPEWRLLRLWVQMKFNAVETIFSREKQFQKLWACVFSLDVEHILWHIFELTLKIAISATLLYHYYDELLTFAFKIVLTNFCFYSLTTTWTVSITFWSLRPRTCRN